MTRTVKRFGRLTQSLVASIAFVSGAACTFLGPSADAQSTDCLATASDEQSADTVPVTRSYQLIAHRGFATCFPENTLVAIDSAFARGAGAVEVDVASTRDTILVLLHDFDVARTTDGHGIVRELTFQEIAQLDACSWFGSEWAPCSVPTLRSALEAVRTREEGVLVLDLKGPFSRGHVDRLLEDIRLAGMLDRVEIISSSILNLSTLRSRDSIVAASYIKVDTTGLGQLDKLRSRAFFLSLDVLFGEPSLIDTLRVRGLEVGGWTADSRERIEAVVGMGVERVVSDVPLR